MLESGPEKIISSWVHTQPELIVKLKITPKEQIRFTAGQQPAGKLLQLQHTANHNQVDVYEAKRS